MTAVEVESKPRGSTIETLQQTVSASRLNTWLTCRLKFWFRYVAGITKPRTASLYVGHTVHGALKLMNKARWRKEELSVDQLHTHFDQLWINEQARETVQWKDGEESAEQQTAWSLVDLYIKQSPIPPNEQPEAVEVPLEADLSHHGLPRLIGIVDLVRAGGRIVDYKTAAQTPNDEKVVHNNELQLTCYSLLYRESTGRVEGGLELHHLIKTKTPKLVVTQQGPVDQRQQARLFKQMESYVEGLGRNDFIPSPGLQCMACNYFRECRRWG